VPESKHRRRRGRPVSRGQRVAATPIARPRKQKTNKLYVAASVIIAVLVIGGFAVGGINFQRPPDTGSSSGEYVEGVGVQQALMSTGPSGLNVHIDNDQTVEYSTSPATSGDHWATPISCGFYEDGLSDERIVHNLEHGNIVVSYNLATDGEVDQLRDALEGIGKNAIWGVTRSYDKIPSGTVALAAWGVLVGPERIVC